MDPIYVTGHRNPDTDSIVSAMAYAALQNALGNREYVAARLGHISDETKLVLDRFGFEPPVRIQTMRTQVQDLDYDTPPALYAPGSAVKNSVMTAGSIVESSVENSVCFRNVRIEKGAVVKNCVLMEKCVVKAGARLENVVCDKNVTVSEDKIVCGTAEHPCVLAKGGVV